MITLELIKTFIETESGVTDIAIKSRQRNLVDLRSCFYKLAKKFASGNTGSAQLGDFLDGRDHATCLHGLKRINLYLGTKQFTANEVYSKVYERLLNLPKEFNWNILTTQDSVMINQYWRSKYISMVDKSHSVINKQLVEIKRLKERTDDFDEDTLDAIKELNEHDFNEFKERNRLFLRVKKQLNKHRAF